METTTASGVGSHALRQARQEAARIRAVWLTRVASDEASIFDVVRAATASDGRPLRAIRIKELLRSQQGWGKSRSGAVLAHLRATSKIPRSVPDHRLNVSWLLDNRSRPGLRLSALIDAIDAQGTRSAPWPGFPFQGPDTTPQEGVA